MKFLSFSENPRENYRKVSSYLWIEIIIEFLLTQLMIIFIGPWAGVGIFLLLLLENFWELSVAKSMLQVTDPQELKKAFELGIKIHVVSVLILAVVFLITWGLPDGLIPVMPMLAILYKTVKAKKQKSTGTPSAA